MQCFRPCNPFASPSHAALSLALYGDVDQVSQLVRQVPQGVSVQAADSRSVALRSGLQFILMYTMMPSQHGCLAFLVVAAALTTRGSKNTLLHMAAFGGHARMVRPALP